MRCSFLIEHGNIQKHVQRSNNMFSSAGFCDFEVRVCYSFLCPRVAERRSHGVDRPGRVTAQRPRARGLRPSGFLALFSKMERERLTPVLNARAASTEGSRRVVKALASGSMIMMGAKSAYTNTSNCTKAELSLAVCKKHAAC